jgi:hypothetical protein
MSLIEFDGYFEGKLEPVKYTRVEVHTDVIDEGKIISFADKIRIKLKQTSMFGIMRKIHHNLHQ